MLGLMREQIETYNACGESYIGNVGVFNIEYVKIFGSEEMCHIISFVKDTEKMHKSRIRNIQSEINAESFLKDALNSFCTFCLNQQLIDKEEYKMIIRDYELDKTGEQK